MQMMQHRHNMAMQQLAMMTTTPNMGIPVDPAAVCACATEATTCVPVSVLLLLVASPLPGQLPEKRHAGDAGGAGDATGCAGGAGGLLGRRPRGQAPLGQPERPLLLFVALGYACWALST